MTDTGPEHREIEVAEHRTFPRIYEDAEGNSHFGEMETEVSDGEKRLFLPGDFLLVEDITGNGHRSRVTGEVRGLAAAVPLEGR